MIDKEKLKDWLAVGEREKHFERIREYVNEIIKDNALEGKTSFLVSTGYRLDTPYSMSPGKSDFYDIWNCEGLSRENRRIVQNKIIDGYRKAGFDVELVYKDYGHNETFEALSFVDIDNAVKDKK